MSTYIIGDVHGCYYELSRLLSVIEFNPKYDKLVFVGDLVGRGPNSLEVLELVMSLGEAVINVLGNHDIKFLAMAYEIIPFDKADNMFAIFQSSKLDQYVSWLSTSKLMYIDRFHNFVVVHAGIPPAWDIDILAQKYINLFKNYVAEKGSKRTIKLIYSGQSLNWRNNMTKEEIIQYTVFGFTRMKYCFSTDHFDTEYQSANQPKHLSPWFLIRDEKMNNGYSLFFGHWAALGLYRNQSITCCDTGCVWGGQLTAIKIIPKFEVYQVESTFNVNGE